MKSQLRVGIFLLWYFYQNLKISRINLKKWQKSCILLWTMERFFLIAFNLIFLLWGQSKADLVLGSWLATDKSVAVEVYKLNDEFRAKVLWFDQTWAAKPMNMRYDTEKSQPRFCKRKYRNGNLKDCAIMLTIIRGKMENLWCHLR